MEQIYLIGGEQVESGGHKMYNAALEIQRSVSNLDSILERQRYFMDDWLCRLENILNASKG